MVVFKYKNGDITGVNAVSFSITDGLYTLIEEYGNVNNVTDGNLENIASITIDGVVVYNYISKGWIKCGNVETAV